MAIARLRWSLRFGDCGAVREASAPLLADARQHGRRHRSLRLLVLRALAEAGCGDMEQAAVTLAEPLRHGASEGFVRLLLDEGPALVPVLRQVLALPSRMQAVGGEALVHAQRLLAALGEPAEPDMGDADHPITGPGTPPGLVEPLTRKELRVLELLASGYSNAAMAEKLFVSDSTVRTICAASTSSWARAVITQAVALARGCGFCADAFSESLHLEM